MVSSDSILPLVLFFTNCFEMVYFSAGLQRRQHQQHIAAYMNVINTPMILLFKNIFKYSSSTHQIAIR